MDFDKALELFEPVLGFEVHVELNTKTKMFSAAPNSFGREPNSDLAPVDLGLPGSLPVVNEQAVKYSISLGLALGCQIAPSSRFARKNYFYPDLGKNYQISQYDEPIAFEGSVEVELADGTRVVVPIERAHMEEDAGKLTHVGGSTGRIQGAEYSLVDYNRAGVPLVEIVTKPIYGTEHRAPEIAKAYVQTIRDIVLSLDISDARMERGNLRCDANVSLRPRGPGEARHTHRDEERELDALRRARRSLRDPASGRDPRRRRLDHAGDPALARRHRHDITGSSQVGRRRLPLLPRARSAAGGAVRRADRAAARCTAGASRRTAPPAQDRVGFQRPGVPGRRERRSPGRGRRDDRGRRDARGRTQVVDRGDLAHRERAGTRGFRSRLARQTSPPCRV